MALLRALPFRPGVVKDDIDLAAGLYAKDSNQIRFVDGFPQAMGGSQQVVDGISGTPRCIFEWTRNDGVAYVAIGTSSRLYAWSNEFGLLDITPIRSSGTFGSNPFESTSGSRIIEATLTAHGASVGDSITIHGASAFGGVQLGVAVGAIGSNPFTTISGSSIINVTHTAHNLSTGDYVFYASATATGGVAAATLNLAAGHRVRVLNADLYQIEVTTVATSSATGGGTPTCEGGRTYEILSVIDSATFTFDGLDEASSSTTGGGAGADYLFGISTGFITAAVGGGYGSGLYGAGLYGVSSASAVLTASGVERTWSMDNYGENLIACVVGGSIYSWNGSFSSRAAILANAPERCNCVVVTPEGFLFACGCDDAAGVFDPLLVRFPSGTNLTLWTPAITNNAGDFKCFAGSSIVGATRSQENVLIFTNNALFAPRFTGQDDQIYDREMLGTNCGLIAVNAVSALNGDIYWMSPQLQPYVYGGGKPRVMPCPLQQWFRSEVNPEQTPYMWCRCDPFFEGVEWMYARNGEDSVGKYIRCDIEEANRDPRAGWSHGSRNRAVMSVGGVFASGRPHAVGTDGVMHEHDIGYSDSGNDVLRFVRYAPLFGEGGRQLEITRTDVSGTYPDGIELTWYCRRELRGAEFTRATVVTDQVGVSDKTVSAAYIEFEFAMSGSQYWRLGVVRTDLEEGALR